MFPPARSVSLMGLGRRPQKLLSTDPQRPHEPVQRHIMGTSAAFEAADCFFADVRAGSQFRLGEAETLPSGLKAGQRHTSGGATRSRAASAGVWSQHAPAERGTGEPVQTERKTWRPVRMRHPG